MTSPISGSSGWVENQLEIILKQQLKIEDLQEKLVNNGGSYAAMLKREEDVQLKFVDLLVMTYPELSHLSASEIVNMMESLDLSRLMSLKGQITDLLGSYPSIAALQDAVDGAFALVEEKSLEESTALVVRDEAAVAFSSASIARADAKSASEVALATWLLARDEYDFAVSNEVLTPEIADRFAQAEAGLLAAQQAFAAADVVLFEASVLASSTQSAYVSATAATAAAEASAAELQGVFSEVTALDTEIQELISGNVFYLIYDSLSDTEKELIALFSN